ncbi:helix-turn-helix domain-containing protein [Xanthomonas arboricola]
MGGSVQSRFGKAVQAARQRLGLSQEAFAAEMGMHRTQLGHIEQGLKDCRLSTIVRLSAALGLSVSQLLDQVDSKKERHC